MITCRTIAWLCILCSCSTIMGQALPGGKSGRIEGSYKIMPVPYVNYDRSIGFAGVATVFRSINESDNGNPAPGIGTGIRFRVFPETNFSVGLDVAAGREDWGLYFQIGEAF